MKPTLLFILLVGLVFICGALSRRFLQHPQTQHALTGDNLTFSCAASHAHSISWYADFFNGSFAELTENTQDIILLWESLDNTNTTITIRARQTWNKTRITCHAEYVGTDFFSNEASLIVYSSLRPFPPSNLTISSINRSTALYVVTWTPSLQRWDSYPIDSFNMVVTDNNVTVFSVVLESNTHEYTLRNFSQPSCSELNFSIAAASLMYGESEYTIVNKKFGSDLEEISNYLNIDTKVYFRSNGTPFVDVEIQIPNTLCFYENWMINYSVSGDSNSSLVSGTMSYNSLAARIHSLSFSIVYGLLMNQNYTLTIIFTDSGESSITASANFDTIILLSSPLTCYLNEKKVASELIVYKITIGICLSAAILILIFLATVLILVHIYQGKERQSKKLGDSTSRVCNAMVHNPIYDGPVYESVQQQFNTLTVTTLQTSSVSDTSADHPCNCSPPSTPTPTHSEKSARYVDPPAQFHISKLRSKSVISHCSAPSGVIDTGNIPRSTSVSVPVIKKTPKQRNKLNLTLPLAGTESGNTNTTGCLMSTSGPILTDVDENYTTMMSPASALIGTAKCSELN